MNIFRSKILTKVLSLLTARYPILSTRRLQPHDDCAVPVQWFSSVGINPLFYPYKPCVLFMGHTQTVQSQNRHCVMRCLIRIFTVLLTECSIRIWKKWKIPPNTSKIGNGLILLIRVGKSIVLKWVKTHQLYHKTSHPCSAACDQTSLEMNHQCLYCSLNLAF